MVFIFTHETNNQYSSHGLHVMQLAGSEVEMNVAPNPGILGRCKLGYQSVPRNAIRLKDAGMVGIPNEEAADAI
jgi:hypothetical protein